MAYTYTPSNITAKQKMNLSVWSLQITSLINSIVELFTSSFLVSFIMQVNVDEPISATLVSIALYYISLYAVMFIAYTLLGYLVDRSNRIGYYRAGILFKGAFIVVIIFLGRDLAQNTILAGAFIGLSEAFYYSSYNVLKGEIIPRTHADKYITVSNILKKVISIVFPILIGYLIDVSTYTTVAIYVLVIVAIQFIFSCLIKSQRPENSVFELFKYLKALRQKTEDTQRIKRFYPAVAGYACTTLISSCITLLTIYTFRTNLNLGLFTALFSFITIICLVLYKRYTKPGHRKGLLIFLSILPVLSSVLVAIYISKWTYIIYNLVMTVCQCLLAYTLDIYRTILLKKTNHYEFIAEHQTVTEGIFQIVRIITYCLMLVLGITLELTGLKILIAIVSLCYPIMAISLIKTEDVEKNYSIETVVASVEATVEEDGKGGIILVEEISDVEEIENSDEDAKKHSSDNK